MTNDESPMTDDDIALMLTLRLPTMVASIRAIQPALSGLPGWEQLSDVRQHDVVLATTELVTNAVVHGNQSDPSRSVLVTAEINTEEIVIVVADQGTGFDLETLVDPTQADARENPGGRGLFVVRKLADRVTVDRSDELCRVTIIFRRA